MFITCLNPFIFYLSYSTNSRSVNDAKPKRPVVVGKKPLRLLLRTQPVWTAENSAVKSGSIPWTVAVRAGLRAPTARRNVTPKTATTKNWLYCPASRLVSSCHCLTMALGAIIEDNESFCVFCLFHLFVPFWWTHHRTDVVVVFCGHFVTFGHHGRRDANTRNTDRESLSRVGK